MKTKFKVYKLHFTTPLHIGDERDDYSISLKTYQSDAMYAALTSCLAKVGREIPTNGDLGFSISSLYPFYQKDEKSNVAYFFPKLIKQKLPENIELNKKIKKVEWVDTSFFEKMINGELQMGDNIVDYIEGNFMSKPKIEENFISSQVAQRVTVSRNFSKDAEPFYMDRVYFKDNSGLFFIAEGNTNLLEKALNILKYEGIGTDRNIGNGFFKVSPDEIEINLPKSEYATNLSMFCPESEVQLNEMLDDKHTSYDFTKRGGWITDAPHNTIRKNTIHMFMPASIFKMNNVQSKVNVIGKIVDLNPRKTYPGIDHSIWRNGKSIFIPIKI